MLKDEFCDRNYPRSYGEAIVSLILVFTMQRIGIVLVRSIFDNSKRGVSFLIQNFCEVEIGAGSAMREK